MRPGTDLRQKYSRRTYPTTASERATTTKEETRRICVSRGISGAHIYLIHSWIHCSPWCSRVQNKASSIWLHPFLFPYGVALLCHDRPLETWAPNREKPDMATSMLRAGMATRLLSSYRSKKAAPLHADGRMDMAKSLVDELGINLHGSRTPDTVPSIASQRGYFPDVNLFRGQPQGPSA